MDDIFRRFFGFRGIDPPNYGDAGISEREDDENLFNNFNNPRGVLRGMFEHFHRDMFQQMESLQREMDDMMKDFGAVDFPSAGNPHPPLEPNDSTKGSPNSRVFFWSTPSPFFRQGEEYSKKSPRDFMLKDEGETESSKMIGPKIPEQRRPTVHLPQNPEKNLEKRDSDLDGKVSDDRLLDMIKRSSVMDSPTPYPEHHLPSRKPNRIFSGQSVSISTFSGPDGKVEQKRVLRDSSGREESTVTRSIGDKSYTVTTVTDETGKQEKHENLQNMNESDLNNFKQLWSRPRLHNSHPSPGDSTLMPGAPPSQPSLPINPDDKSLFNRLFGSKDW